MSEKFEKLMQEQSEALGVLKGAVKEVKQLGLEGKAGASEAKEKIDRTNEVLDKIETKNQDLMTQINEQKQKTKAEKEEFEKEIKAMQAKISKLGTSPSQKGLDPEVARRINLDKEMKSLVPFAHNAKATQDQYASLEIDKKYFRSDVNTDGGFLMKESYDDRIRRPIDEISPIRQIAFTKTIDGLAENLSVEAQDFVAYWTAEGASFTESMQKYSAPRIPLHSATVKTEATNKSAYGSRFNFDTIVSAGFRRVTLKLEGAAFVNGDGVGKPTGFMSDKAGIQSINSGVADNISAAALIDMTGQIKEGYDGMYVMNRKTLSKVRQLTFPNGELIWQPGQLGAGVPNQINGESYTLVPDMADIAADAYPVAYGDFMEGYEIIDSNQAIFLRNPYRKDGYVVYTLESYTGADVVIKEALVKLKCST